jgi:hypothetical protein
MLVGKIGAMTYTIELDDSIDCAGEFEHKHAQAGGHISVHPDQGGTFLLDTVCHEVIHAASGLRHSTT